MGDTIHLECLWFCFAKVIKADLNKVKDRWNSYHIRHSRHDTVSGVPDVLFFLPEYSVATDRLISVEQAQVDEMDMNETVSFLLLNMDSETSVQPNMQF